MLVCVLTSLGLKYFPFFLKTLEPRGVCVAEWKERKQKRNISLQVHSEETWYFSVKRGMAVALSDHRDVKMERHKEKKEKQPNETAVTTDFSTVSEYPSWSLLTVITGTADFLEFSFRFPDILGVCCSMKMNLRIS